MWGGVFGGAVAGWLVTVTDWPTAFGVGAVLAVAAGVAALGLRSPSPSDDVSEGYASPSSED
jgi:OFA family oxalate/formate antiporter-like MFS transporter